MDAPTRGSPPIIRAATDADADWICGILTGGWGGTRIVTPGGVHDATALPALVAEMRGQRVGLLTYSVVGDACEVVTLNSMGSGRGVGTALLDAVREEAVRRGCRRVWLVTTNDNTAALAFYQRNGWDIVALHRDALAEWRRLKPSIAEVGLYGIPVRHALELELRL